MLIILTFNDAFEGQIDVAAIQRACLDDCHLLALRKIGSIFSLDLSHFGQVSLVANHHESHVLLAVGAQLGQPILNVLKRLLLSYIVNYESS